MPCHAMHHTINMQQASPCLQQVCVQMAAAATYAPSTSSICHTPANCEPRARLKMHFLDGLEGQTSRSGGRTRVKLLQSSEAGRALVGGAQRNALLRAYIRATIAKEKDATAAPFQAPKAPETK